MATQTHPTLSSRLTEFTNRSEVRELLRPLVGLVIITGVFLLLAPTFRQWVAIKDVFENSTVLFIMATGTTVILISGGLDLSVGSILALVSVVTGSLLLANVPWWLAVLGGLVAGALCGVTNGLIIVGTRIPTLIATLGTQLIFRGFANMIGAGKDMHRFPPEFQWLGAGSTGPLIISAIAFVVDLVHAFADAGRLSRLRDRRQRGGRPAVRRACEPPQGLLLCHGRPHGRRWHPSCRPRG